MEDQLKDDFDREVKRRIEAEAVATESKAKAAGVQCALDNLRTELSEVRSAANSDMASLQSQMQLVRSKAAQELQQRIADVHQAEEQAQQADRDAEDLQAELTACRQQSQTETANCALAVAAKEESEKRQRALTWMMLVHNAEAAGAVGAGAALRQSQEHHRAAIQENQALSLKIETLQGELKAALDEEAKMDLRRVAMEKQIEELSQTQLEFEDEIEKSEGELSALQDAVEAAQGQASHWSIIAKDAQRQITYLEEEKSRLDKHASMLAGQLDEKKACLGEVMKQARDSQISLDNEREEHAKAKEERMRTIDTLQNEVNAAKDTVQSAEDKMESMQQELNSARELMSESQAAAANKIDELNSAAAEADGLSAQDAMFAQVEANMLKYYFFNVSPTHEMHGGGYEGESMWAPEDGVH